MKSLRVSTKKTWLRGNKNQGTYSRMNLVVDCRGSRSSTSAKKHSTQCLRRVWVMFMCYFLVKRTGKMNFIFLSFISPPCTAVTYIRSATLWLLLFLLVRTDVGVQGRCTMREPPDAVSAPKKSDLGFYLSINGDPDTYVPGQIYTVSLKGDRIVDQLHFCLLGKASLN